MLRALASAVLLAASAAPDAVPSAPTETPDRPADRPAASEARTAVTGSASTAETDGAPDDVAEVLNPAFPAPVAAAAPAPVRRVRLALAELAPVYTGELARARAEFDLGHYDRVLALLPKASAPVEVRYLRALASLRVRPTPVVAAEMERLADELPAIADRCWLEAGLALEEQGRGADAQRLFGRIPPSSRVFPDARFGLARVLRRSGDVAGAAAAIDPLTKAGSPLWGRDVAAEALVTQADLARARRDAAAERSALLALWSQHPRSALAAQAERRLGAGPYPAEAVVARAESLVEVHRNRPGLDALKPVLPRLALPEALACRARFVQGRALRKERRHTEAQEVLAPVVRACTDPDLRVRALYLLGTSQAVVAPAQGARTFDQLAKDFPEHPLADDALFLAADLLADAGDVHGALERLARIGERYPQGDQVGEALFKAFWLHHRLDARDEALADLDRLEKGRAAAEESYDVERARYWRARVEDGAGHRPLALDAWEALAIAHPATYYGLLARERVAERDPVRAARIAERLATPVGVVPPVDLDAGTLLDDAHFRAGIQLLRLGFTDAASSELQAARRAGQPAEAQRLLVEALARTGDARAAHGIARLTLRGDLSGPLSSSTRPFWDIAYPDAFRELVVRHTRGTAVEPELLQALMREESALDPKALSWAGALGLTQLMLPTARDVARTLKLKAPTSERLLDPGTNIQLGAAYLGRLLQRFDGNVAYALASYNAGAGAVDRWRSARRNLELDAWVEEIPLAETRGYVKRVVRSWNTYRLLGGRPLAGLVKTAVTAPVRAERSAP